MSMNFQDVQEALRDRLKALSVTTTGAITISATGSAFVRASGDFRADLFFPGMEITGTGFTNSENHAAATIIEALTNTLTVNRVLETESAGAGKTLAIGLPAQQAWEGESFEPTTGVPYIEEEFLPGTSAQISVGAGGTMEHLPLWIVRIYIPADVGIGAHNIYSQAIMERFAPRTKITLDSGLSIAVTGTPAPFRGQALNRKKGWLTTSVTIPLRLHTINP